MLPMSAAPKPAPAAARIAARLVSAWGSFAPTVQNEVLDIDLLVTRTVLPLAIPAQALLDLLRGQAGGSGSSLGIRCA